MLSLIWSLSLSITTWRRCTPFQMTSPTSPLPQIYLIWTYRSRPPIGGFSCGVLYRFPMYLPIPFCKRARIRFAEPVETVVPTYHIRDFGLEYQDGSIDSIAVGVSLVDRSSDKSASPDSPGKSDSQATQDTQSSDS